MKNNLSCNGFRNARGQSSMELALGAILMITLSALVMDMTLLNFAMCLNDSVCRDAARAAAQTNTQASALQAATAQLKLHATDGIFVSQPVLTSTSSPDFVYNDFGGNPPANTSSYVTVSTSVTVKVPAPIVFFGAKFYASNGTLVMKRRYTYPIIKEQYYGG
jgi:Flp pilus assembly protein TadG